MVLDKLAPYWTEEEKKQLNKLNEVMELYRLSAEPYTSKGESIPAEIAKSYQSAYKESNDLIASVVERYASQNGKESILADVRDIVDNTTREDFLSLQKQIAEVYGLLVEKEKYVPQNKTLSAYFQRMTIEDYDNCRYFFLSNLEHQIAALGKDKKALKEIDAIVEAKVSQWYQPHKTHYPIPYSKPTDAIAFLSQKSAKIDNISGDATIDRFSVQLRIAKFKELKASLGISTDKLLSTALTQFAQKNDLGRRNTPAKNRQVAIPLKDYAALLGYDVEEHETSTPEEAAAEKKRIKTTLDNVRKKTKKDLDILYNLSFEWQEIVRGELVSYSSTRLLSSKTYDKGTIYITFTPEIADHLVTRGLITQYNTRLIGMDERNANAYYIMRKLEEHYNMDVNQNNNRHDRIKIETLLAVTDLPTIEEVNKTDRGHWERRIKDRFEENLNYLKKNHYLKDYEYTHAKGLPLTQEEAYNITDYNTFSQLYLHFEMEDIVDQKERQQRRKEEREKRKKSKGK